MRTLRPQYPLHLLCRVLEVSRSGYSAWRTQRPSKRAQDNAHLEVAIQAAHIRTRQTDGRSVSRRNCVRTAFQPRSAADSTHALPVADNVLAQSFATRRPNETWVTDITSVPIVKGWLYLAGVKVILAGCMATMSQSQQQPFLRCAPSIPFVGR